MISKIENKKNDVLTIASTKSLLLCSTEVETAANTVKSNANKYKFFIFSSWTPELDNTPKLFRLDTQRKCRPKK